MKIWLRKIKLLILCKLIQRTLQALVEQTTISLSALTRVKSIILFETLPQANPNYEDLRAFLELDTRFNKLKL